MAALVGIFVAVAVQAQQPGRSADLDQHTATFGGGNATALAQAGAPATPGPHGEPCVALTGSTTEATHIWDRIVLVPHRVDLGLILSDQTFTIEVWNTHRDRGRVLQSVTTSGVGGFQVTAPAMLPLLISVLCSWTFTGFVPEGAPSIDAAAEFVFPNDETAVFEVTGMSIVLFPFEPDWEGGFAEKVEYLTGLSIARSGAEQRQKLRRTPRRTLSWRVSTLDAQETQLLGAMLWNDQAKVFGVPVWSDAVQHTGNLSQGATTISIDTTTRLFTEGGQAMVWRTPLDCEVQTISGVSANLLTISALSKAYTGPVLVVPVLPGRLGVELGTERPVGEIAQADVSFLCEVV